VSFLTPSADVVALVKPQFEVGKGRVGKGGIVQDPQQQYQALYDVLHVAQTCDLSLQDGIVSPLRGAKGNREFLVHLRWQNPLSSVAQIQAVCTRLAFALTP
jgi:23S rRNA (cytidine1920-2'-O)/16S rRNA (cytidine1409-2'-O)-methyltransferase